MSVSGRDLALPALFGIVNFAVGLPLFVLGARHMPAIETALISSVDAPLAPLWVWLVFGETPSASTLVGGAIAFAAVAVQLGVVESAWLKKSAASAGFAALRAMAGNHPAQRAADAVSDAAAEASAGVCRIIFRHLASPPNQRDIFLGEWPQL